MVKMQTSCWKDPRIRSSVKTTDDCRLIVNGEADDLDVIVAKWQQPLEGVFPVRTADFREKTDTTEVEKLHYTERNTSGPKIQVARPKVVIPAFPGTNCEMDSARAFEKAGAEADIHIIRNLTAAQLEDSILELERKIRESQIIMIPGGFSGGDEPDGSAKSYSRIQKPSDQRCRYRPDGKQRWSDAGYL